MYADALNRLLFVANQGNATLQVVDLRAMQITATVKVGVKIPMSSHLIHTGIGCTWRTEGGGLWVYRVEGKRLVAESILDIPQAHTVSVDSSTRFVYLPLQNVEAGWCCESSVACHREFASA